MYITGLRYLVAGCSSKDNKNFIALNLVMYSFAQKSLNSPSPLLQRCKTLEVLYDPFSIPCTSMAQASQWLGKGQKVVSYHYTRPCCRWLWQLKNTCSTPLRDLPVRPKQPHILYLSSPNLGPGTLWPELPVGMRVLEARRRLGNKLHDH